VCKYYNALLQFVVPAGRALQGAGDGDDQDGDEGDAAAGEGDA
jgi:hypothetical protein